MRKVIFTDLESQELSILNTENYLVLDVDYVKDLYQDRTKSFLDVHSTFKTIENHKEVLSSKVKKEVLNLVENYLKLDISFIVKHKDMDKLKDEFKELYKLIEKYRYRKFQLSNTKQTKIHSTFTIVEDIKETMGIKVANLENFKNIHHIGDIHGCHDTLLKFFKDGLNEEDFYIFTGDLLERGAKNVETLKYLLSIRKLPNVIFIEGNHDRYLFQYANDLHIHGKRFKKEVVPLLENSGISKKEISKLCSSFLQMFVYEFHGKTVLVSHGGFTSFKLDELAKANGSSITRGVGNYSLNIDYLFDLLHEGSNIYQVHGHRNNFKLPVINGQSINLEGRIEDNGHLRVATLSADTKTFKAIEIKTEKTDILNSKVDLEKSFESVENLVENFRQSSKFVNEIKLRENISSFQHNKGVFFNREWNEVTNKARGIHIDTNKMEIIARGFDKYHNIDEKQSLESFVESANYPITAFEKLNGYLGLVGVHEDEFYIATKSHIDSPFAVEFKKAFHEMFSENQKKKMKEFILDKKVTLAFEVIVNHFDKHIVKYPQNRLVLLNAILNEPKFSTLGWEEVVAFAEDTELDYASKIKVFHTSTELLEHIRFIQKDFENIKENKLGLENYPYDYEGYVLIDSFNQMVKFKFPYYLFWKSVRSSIFMYINRKNKNKDLTIDEEIKRQGISDYVKGEIVKHIVSNYLDITKYSDFEIVDVMHTKEFKEFVSELVKKY